MTFGKRSSVPKSQCAMPHGGARMQAGAPGTGNVPLTNPVFVERVKLQLADLQRINTEATNLAHVIRTGERLHVERFAAVAPEIFPINVSGFSRHFNFQRDGKIRHGVICYLLPGDMLDRKAQLHLLEMTTAILSLNALCVSSHEEGALSIALQSPAARDGVDKVLVMSSMFAAMWQNLVYQQSVVTGTAEQQKRGPDLARMQKTIAEAGAKARSEMLVPDRFGYHFPDMPSPAIVAETEVADHAGQLVVNQVYLPVELARPVMAKMAAAQARPS